MPREKFLGHALTHSGQKGSRQVYTHQMQVQPGKPVRFGVYEVNVQTAELRKQGTLLRLQEQPFQVLAALLERPGEV